MRVCQYGMWLGFGNNNNIAGTIWGQGNTLVKFPGTPAYDRFDGYLRSTIAVGNGLYVLSSAQP
jgi:hypothetical protein